MITIYCHTSPSGKRYVGQTTMTMEERWAEHVWAARVHRGCRLLGRAIRKHGDESFRHEVLETCDTRAGANAAEVSWIARLGCIAPHGYNLTDGGDARNTHPDTKARLRDAQRAAHAARTPEERSALARKGNAIRSEKMRAAHAARTPEERSAIAKKALGCKTPEERKEISRRGHANRTPEQKRAAVQKMLATRAARALAEVRS